MFSSTGIRLLFESPGVDISFVSQTRLFVDASSKTVSSYMPSEAKIVSSAVCEIRSTLSHGSYQLSAGVNHVHDCDLLYFPRKLFSSKITFLEILIFLTGRDHSTCNPYVHLRNQQIGI